MPKPMPEALQKRLYDHYHELEVATVEIGEEEFAKLSRYLDEQIAVRSQNMSGDPENIKQYCLAKIVETIDWVAMFPQWTTEVRQERQAYDELRECARTGNALAHMLMKKANRLRPELDNPTEHLQVYVKRLIEKVEARRKEQHG
jgi:hypothetical protein